MRLVRFTAQGLTMVLDGLSATMTSRAVNLFRVDIGSGEIPRFFPTNMLQEYVLVGDEGGVDLR